MSADEDLEALVDSYEWTVGFVETSFGKRFDHGLGGCLLMMVLPRLGGWQTLRPYVILPGQAYAKDAVEYLEENEGVREIALLNVDMGDWRTIWVEEGSDIRLADTRSEAGGSGVTPREVAEHVGEDEKAADANVEGDGGSEGTHE